MDSSRKAVSCPAEITLKAINGRWKVLILQQLFKGVTRSGELYRSLNGISQKMLAQQLKQLEEESLVIRKVYATVPPKVEYSLTSCGQSLKPIFEAMHEWGLKHMAAKSFNTKSEVRDE